MRDGQSVCSARARTGAETTLTSARMRPSRARASMRARWTPRSNVEDASHTCARLGRARSPPVRVVVASIRARANTYDRLRHDSLHFRRHGASFTSFERARDVRGGV